LGERLRRRSRSSERGKGRTAKAPKRRNSAPVARLRRELNEAWKYQAATADVLKVIGRSAFALSTVLDTLVESAARLCDADHAWLFRRDGEFYRWAASYGHSNKEHDRLKEYVLTLSFLPGRGSALERAVLEGRSVQIADVAADPEYTRHGIRRIGDYRTALSVPLLREGLSIGALVLTRSQPQTFSDRQVDLLVTFADQAVIAIENTRLLSELRQSLEQQATTAEVLGVISSSPSDLGAVFQTMLANATHLCEANFGTLNLHRDGEFPLAATHNVPETFIQFRRVYPIIKPGPRHPLARVAYSRQALQIADMRTEVLYLEKDPSFIAMVDLAGARTLLIVPMLKENDLLGVITIFRQDVRPFTEKQIEIVKNFATQAVIAIENARLLSELRQSLELQTATADVLRVISSSPSDLRPVFDAIAENAARLCHGFDVYVQLREGNLVRYVAHCGGIIPTSPSVGGTRPLTRGLVIGRAMLESRLIHLLDAQAESEEFPEGSAIARRTGYRTIIAVPLMRLGHAIGTIAVRRVEARLFSDKEVELLSNFAAEAVIAIENARLLTELRQRTADLSESLEQQTATFEVLKVISSSPGELEPVFRAILENATRICGAKIGILFRFDDGAYTAVATLGVTAEYKKYLNQGPIRAGPGTGLGRVAAGEQTVHIIDTQAEQAYADREPLRVATAELGGARSLLNVPMLKDSELIGAIGIYRQEVRPFTNKQVELVTNFAAQAVIAIENARLLNELAQRTEQLEMRSHEIAKLNEQLEQRVANQIGELERMSRLRRFLPPQVADLIVATGTEQQLESHRREITALFCDLRGFTGFSESSDPEDVMALLRDYHEAIGQIIFKYGGTLERFAGDGVMVIFNDPVPVENPALQAVLMALDMRRAIGGLIEKRRELGHDLGFGIGIAHGFATLGTIGFEGRRDYAAIGTVSNVASRLCDEAKPGQILISPRVRQAVEKVIMVEPVGEFTLKGIRLPMPAYNVLESSPSKPN
jgi:two-component system, NtrC family, sensor kinase